jgi:MFS family permease
MEKKQTHIIYGFLTGLAMVILSVILYVVGLAFESWSQWLSYIPFFIGLVLNAMNYAKANDNYVTYGNVWGSGIKASMIITLVVLAWGIISTFVFPEMREKGMEMARERMAQKDMSDEQIDQALQMTQKYFLPFMIAGVVFGTMIAGAILSAIAAAFPKKKGDGMPPIAQQ